MKLRRLTITNIASIRSAAIDFTADPLASAPVYLISGVTGSGKTTILDAICLALYANTPRLRNLSKNGHSKDTVEVEDSKSIAFTDVRNMVRRDAEEGRVALEFTGNDGIDYTAEWSAARPRRKIGKPLMTPGRSLSYTDTDGSEMVLTKSLEINARIQRAVGLDFDKFCRTTMLAQGDFTRFLHARNEEKSEILEKITGTGIYKRIGIGIRESYKERKDAVTAAEQLLERTNVLPDEELASLKEEINALSRLSSELTGQGNIIATKRLWLDNDKRLASALQTAEDAVLQAKASIQALGIEAKRRLIADYDATAEPRRMYSDAVKARAALKAGHDRIECLHREYTELTAGLVHALQRVDKLRSKQAELTELIGRMKPNADIYERTPAIAEKLSALTRYRQHCADMGKEIESKKKALTETLIPACHEAVEKYNQSVAYADTAATDIIAAEKLLESYGIDALRATKERLLTTRAEIQKVQILLRIKAGIEQQTVELNSDLQALAKTNADISSLTAERDLKKAAYERERESIDALIRKLRAELTVGCDCPLCRQTVGALPDESAIDSIVAIAEQSFRQADARLAGAVDERNRLEAKTAAARKQIESQSADLPDVIEIPEQTLEDVANELEVVEVRIKEAENVETELKNARAREVQYRNHKLSAKELVDTCTNAMQMASRSIEDRTEQLKAIENELGRTCSEVTIMLQGYAMPFSAVEHPGRFTQHLSAEADSYRHLCETYRLLSTELAESEAAYSRGSSLLSSLAGWQSPAPPEAKEIPELDSRIVALLANVKSANDAMETAGITVRESEKHVGEFLKQSGMPEMLFKELCEIGADEISQAKADVDNAVNRLTIAETTLANARQAIEDHHKERPEGLDEDTAESLVLQAREIADRIEDINQQIGAKRQEVESDDKFRKERGHLLADLETKRAEAAKWQELDALFGDADGKKFSTIAQSYVLMDLIDSANRYMSTLSDRYKLRVEPNSFIISVEDAYDGFKARATNTISGGESFLVSLALALALSDIAEDLEVDTLFIDEGFGSLSGEALQDAITTLQQLHSQTGRHVGIISHVEELREQIPVQIHVERNSRTSVSRVTVISKTCF